MAVPFYMSRTGPWSETLPEYQEPSLPTVDAGTNPGQTSMSGDDSPSVWSDWLGLEGECVYDLFDLQDSGLVAA